MWRVSIYCLNLPLSFLLRCFVICTSLQVSQSVFMQKQTVTILQCFKNATRLTQAVNFISLVQNCSQFASTLIAPSSFIKSVKIKLDPTWYLQTGYDLLKQLASSLWRKGFDNELASSLLTACSREPEQAIRMNPDIGLITARKQACRGFAATSSFLAQNC